MSAEARTDAVLAQVSRPSRQIVFPRWDDGKPKTPSQVFAQNVFTLKVMQERLPKPIHAKFIQQMKGRQNMDKTTADAVAHAVKVWAMEKGATHFTHWFQPQNDSTAEKHDSFLSLRTSFGPMGEETTAIDCFSGSQLLQSEPDASSFPSGGMRTTFEARGYTVWDTTSPMFLQHGPHGTMTLYIPCVFISYNGDALDEKTVLLRSSEQINSAAVRLLHVLGETEVKRVYTTLGTEQEFFLVDRNLYALRPDLKICGRSLIGNLPPKHQQLEDHYFGRIPSRVLASMSECELELYKLGVPVKTRHNEVAPAQFEMAPIFEEASIAVDHNLLTMDVIHRIAHKYKLKALFHEKPFKGVNGSGKHCNWAIATDTGDNLLDPTIKPETNYRFLIVLVAILNAVLKHGALLRAAIASASNDHRLGASEAPPSIISVFLGEQLTEVLNSIEENREVKNFSQPQVQSVKVGGTVLDLRVATLPPISRDLTDRNRTSPFAFTGNKFEFRAVGSKQSPSFPVTVLNAAVASSLNEIAETLEKCKGNKPALSQDDIIKVVRDYIIKTKAIRFEGDGYSDAWVKEAQKRGLPNIPTAPEAFEQLLKPVQQKVLCETIPICSHEELESRYHVYVEKYAKDLMIEANTLKLMISQSVIPAAFEYRKNIAETLKALQTVMADNVKESPEMKTLSKIGSILTSLQSNFENLNGLVSRVMSMKDHIEQSRVGEHEILPCMEACREDVDKLEEIVPDNLWPFPKYTELLFT